MPIRWEDFEPQGYEKLVSVLLSRLHADAQRIDGKGGDGGRDVQIVHKQTDQITDAFELKSFTGRMTTSRRRQVADSLKRAAALEPRQWTLVVPIDPTPGEDRWFRELGKEYPFPTGWAGKTWLDEKVSAFPDIRRYFVEGASDEVVRLLRELREEQAAVTDVHDAVGRLQTLRERLNEIDPYYRYELSTGETAEASWPANVILSVDFGDARVDLHPKYSGASRDRPITFDVKLVFRPGDGVVLDALNYGQPVTIPPHIVSDVTIDAPSGLGGSFSGREIDIHPVEGVLDEPITLALSLMDGDRLLTVCPVHIEERTRGLRGFVVAGTDSTGWLQFRLKVDTAAKKLVADFQLSPRPAMPVALVPLFRWLDAWQPAHRLSIRWPGGPELCCEIPTPFEDEGLGRVVEALAYLQNRSGIHWEMSPSLTLEQGQEILKAESLLKGESVDYAWTSLTLNPNRWGPELEELVDGYARQVIIEQDSWLELEGIEIPLGRIRTHVESARLADPGVVQQARKNGLVPHLRLVPGDSSKARRTAVSELK